MSSSTSPMNARSGGRAPRSRSRIPGASLLTLVLALLFCLPAPVDAQYFGRNKVQYDLFDFRVLKTPHFDIHHYPDAERAMEDVARMSERWYERLARIFQHEFESEKPLIFYANHPDFQQTNVLRGFIGEGTGGVTESLKNRVIMPLGGAYADTDHVLGHELVHAFQYDLAQARTAGGGMQGFARLPLWLVEGMAEYLSVGREDTHTSMWLRDAVRRDDLPTIRQMTRERRFFPYRFGHAFWAYVGGTYGDEAVPQLFRRAIRTGWENSVNEILGTSSDSLSADWHEAVRDQHLPLLEDRTVPEEVGTLLLSPETGAGTQNVSPSLSPDGRHVAFLSEKDLFSIDLFLADARTGEVIRTLSSANANPHFDAIRFIDSSGTWSPDGDRFAFVVFARGANQIVVVDVEEGDVLRRIPLDGVGEARNPAWSPDGGSIAFSGMAGGVSNLYVVDLETEDLRKLTDDRHGDVQPTWSPDGSTIAFVSDRGPETDFDRLVYSRNRLVLLDVESREVRPLSVFGNVRHSNPQFAPDGETLYFISDADGFSDIYRLTLETGEVRRITRVATGVSGITGMSPAMSVASQAGTLAFSVFDAFEFHVYTLDRQDADAGARVVAEADPVPGRFLPPSLPRLPSRVAQYLDDPRIGLAEPSHYSLEDSEDYQSRLTLDYIGQPSLGVATDRFGNYIGGGAAAFFSDMLGDRSLGVAVQAQGTFKDIGGQFFYLDQKRRWNWGAAGGRTPLLRSFITGGIGEDGSRQLILFRQRIFIDSATGLLSYPFSQTRRFEANLGFTRYSFDLEAERLITDQFGRIIDREREQLDTRDPLSLFQGSLALVGDNSFQGFTSPVRGGRYRMEVQSTFGTVDFQTLIADYRRYFSPDPNLTLAIRGLHFGRYGSQVEQSDVIQEMFLGFETFIRGYSFESFETRECTSEAGQGDACPEFSRLFGHRIAVGNVELRVPLLGTDRFGLINFPYIPTEIAVFTDVGLAWDGSRDPVLRLDRHTHERVPLISSGVSARFNILGFLILEAYYAQPWQRPAKGPHWGFHIAPGW